MAHLVQRKPPRVGHAMPDLQAGDWPIVHRTLTGTFIDAYYVQAPELGHYLEYVRPFDAGIDFYAGVPAN